MGIGLSSDKYETANNDSYPSDNKLLANPDFIKKYYRDITFDTLKERHDNFFFDKAIETKNIVHDTMHFQGILRQPNNPNLILFSKQLQQLQAANQSSNNNYSKLSHSNVEKQGIPNYPSQSINSPDLSSQLQLAGGRISQNQYNTQSQQHSGFNNPYQNLNEEDLWNEFTKHFNRKSRDSQPKQKVNHHDFMDGSFLPKLNCETRHNKVEATQSEKQPRGDQSLRMPAYVSKDFMEMEGQNILRQRRYKQMQVRSVSIPMNKHVAKAKETNKKLQYKMKMDKIDRTFKEMIEQNTRKAQNFDYDKRKEELKKQKKQNEKAIMKYEERYIFVLVDGQNIADDDLKFTYVEFHERLA